MSRIRLPSKTGIGAVLRAALGGGLVLFLASYLLITIGGWTHQGFQSIDSERVELTDQHRDGHEHEPGSGHQGGACSVTACSSATLMQGGGDYHVDLSSSAGFIPVVSRLHGIVLAGDPPLPRLGSS